MSVLPYAASRGTSEKVSHSTGWSNSSILISTSLDDIDNNYIGRSKSSTSTSRGPAGGDASSTI